LVFGRREIDRKGGFSLIITRETDYALRIVRALADGKQATAEEICKRELLPKQFVYKIIKKLERIGLIQIIRGVHGGYRLIGDLEKMNMYDMVNVMESDRLISACIRPGFQCGRREQDGKTCQVHKQLQELQEAVDNELKARSLAQLIWGQ
jgi:Rrf2 family protein